MTPAARSHVRARRLLPLVAIVLLAAALRLPTIASQSLWTDEALSLTIAKLPLFELVKRVIDWEQIPPVHHILLHYWMKLFGDSDASLRMPSGIAGIASVAMVYVLVRRLMGHRMGLIAALLLAVMPIHIHYSQEARTYALHVLVGLISCDLFVRLLRRPTQRHHAAYVLVSALFFYTHIFAAFTLLAQHVAYVIMLWRSRRSGSAFALRPREWIIDNIAIAALIAPWVPVIRQWTKLVKTNFWVKQVTFDDISRVYWMYSGSTPVFVATTALVVVATWRWRRRSGFLILLALMIVPIIVPATISVLTRPSFSPRYTLLAAVAMAGIAAAGIAALRPTLIRWLVVLGIAIAMPFGDAADMPKPPWREVGRYIEQNVPPGDLVVIHLAAGRRLYDHYVRRTDIRRLGFDSPNLPVSYPLEPSGRRAWLVFHDSYYPLNRILERAPVRIGRRFVREGVMVLELIDEAEPSPAVTTPAAAP